MGAYTDGRRRLTRYLHRLALAGLGLMSTPVITFGNVFETDDRRPVTQEDQLDFVGVIACQNTGRLPTASLIALPDRYRERTFEILLTVAHAFYTPQGKMWNDCHFQKEGEPTKAAPITGLIVGTTTPGQGWSEDWAVARIGTRMTDHEPTPQLTSSHPNLPHAPRLSSARPSPAIVRFEELMAMRRTGGTVLLVGHNGEQMPLLLSSDCGPRRKTSGHYNLQDNRVFNHDCDMMAGWSGGPLLLRHQGKTLLIGINATEYNSVVHQQGWPFDGRFNPNTAIRINQEILKAIETLADNDNQPTPQAPLRLCESRNGTTC